MLLTIDPGADSGWALANPKTKSVVACGFRAIVADWTKITKIVIERPHTGRTRAKKKDIITLAIRAGEVGGIARYLSGTKPQYIEPTRWKGSVSKEECHIRVREKMTQEEMAIFDAACQKVAASKRHNVLDAIGIALFAMNR